MGRDPNQPVEAEEEVLNVITFTDPFAGIWTSLVGALVLWMVTLIGDPTSEKNVSVAVGGIAVELVSRKL